jgi:hypothetical protein
MAMARPDLFFCSLCHCRLPTLSLYSRATILSIKLHSSYIQCGNSQKSNPKAHQDTPATDVEAETNKRTELRQIEVDKARLELDRLRKTEFEEQQRLSETA